MNRWITMRFGTESVIQVFIEIIYSIDEKEKNIMFIEDNITLYTDRVERWWLIELCTCNWIMIVKHIQLYE